jgi:hypothetical protein
MLQVSRILLKPFKVRDVISTIEIVSRSNSRARHAWKNMWQYAP